MVIILAIEVFDVETHAAISGEGLKELFKELGIHVADLVTLKLDLPDKVRPFAEVHGGAAERLVHGQIGMSVACNPSKIAQRVLNGLPNHDPRIFDRMVTINVEITFRFYGLFDKGMATKRVQHMVEKADSR